VELALALVALVLALIALATARGVKGSLEEEISDARRTARNVRDEVEQLLETQRELMARIAEGQKLDRDQILEGRLWGELSGRPAMELAASDDTYVLDVRTPQETAGGIIPGAVLIPIEELEERLREVPRKGQKLVYCAGGARSAAACELLSQDGVEGLHNLDGGFGSWAGPREAPGQD